jgi:hypothetical protein
MDQIRRLDDVTRTMTGGMRLESAAGNPWPLGPMGSR